jgi:hypothetical protein
MADKKNAAGAGLFDSALAGSVKESAQQIWLAGMGAFAKAPMPASQICCADSFTELASARSNRLAPVPFFLSAIALSFFTMSRSP